MGCFPRDIPACHKYAWAIKLGIYVDCMLRWCLLMKKVSQALYRLVNRCSFPSLTMQGPSTSAYLIKLNFMLFFLGDFIVLNMQIIDICGNLRGGREILCKRSGTFIAFEWEKINKMLHVTSSMLRKFYPQKILAPINSFIEYHIFNT